MLPILIAGGVFLATPQASTQPEPEMTNVTLLNETMLAKEVVTRTRWGTPMPPDGKGGYSVIQKVNADYIKESLIQPPLTSGPVYRPSAPVILNIELSPVLPKP